MSRKTKGWLALLCAAAVGMTLQARAATVVVTSDITSDTTWESVNTYRLDNQIFVKNGATLTIEAGTLIQGDTESGSGTDDPGALIIARNAKIKAMGTATDPIVFTSTNGSYAGSTANLNDGRTAEWGGVILLGNTYIATDDGEPSVVSPNAALELQIEGLGDYAGDSKYGGGDDDDDSGEMHYVSIRYGGYVLGSANEINGLTLGAVGRATDIDHIEVYQNKDDGLEFFGGTVNTKYILAWMIGDDSFDWDEGFRGKGQFWCVVQGPIGTTDKSDKGSEMDGGMGDASLPSSCPTIFNATYIGHGETVGNKANTALHFRDGTGGRYINSLFLDFSGACALIEGLPDGSSYNNTYYGDKYDAANNTVNDYVKDAYYTHDTAGKMLEIQDCVFGSFGYTNAFGCVGAADDASGFAGEYGSSGKDSDNAHYGLDTGLDIFSDWNNTYSDAALTTIISDMQRDTSNGQTLSGYTYYPMLWVEPTLPAGSPALTTTNNPPNDGFYSDVAFIGAFGPDADGKNWALDWTLASQAGGMDMTGGSFGNFTEPPEVTFMDQSYSIQFATEVGETYQIQTAPDRGSAWSDYGSTIAGDGNTYTTNILQDFSDTRVYRVIIP